MHHHETAHHKQKQALTFAFWLNLFFSGIEIAGAVYTNSTAILADAIHDLGDSLAIGMGIVFEHIAGRKPDAKYTYGYKRFSLLSALILSILLLVGAAVMVWKSVDTFIEPHPVNSRGMFGLAVLGIVINGIAFLRIRHAAKEHARHNSKAIMLHFLEDVLGWVAVLVGSIFIYLTDWYWVDGALSITIAVYIGRNAFINLKETVPVFLQVAPAGIAVDELRAKLMEIKGVIAVDALHVWALDEDETVATVKLRVDNSEAVVRTAQQIEQLLQQYRVQQVTVQVNIG